MKKKIFILVKKVRRLTFERCDYCCEMCGEPGFLTPSGKLFLECHHRVFLSRGGEDKIWNTAGVCGNCHNKIHYGLPEDYFRSERIFNGIRRAQIREFELEYA